jgi:hypothetical protein
MSGVEARRDHREGRLTLRTREVQPIALPPIDADIVRETREARKYPDTLKRLESLAASA